MRLSELFGFDSIILRTEPLIYDCIDAWFWTAEGIPDYDIWVTLAGSGKIEINERAYTLKAGTCLIIPPEAKVQAEQNIESPMTVFYCHVDFLDSCGKRVQPERLRWDIREVKVGDLGLLIAMTRNLVHSKIIAVDKSVQQLQLLQLVTFIVEISKQSKLIPEDSRLGRAIEAIEHDPSYDWTLQKLADIAGLSKNHFGRLFTDRYSMTPKQYTIEERMRRARFLLTDSSLNISEIAHSLGYHNVQYFSRQFREQHGISPRKWRPD